jgi:hypothetical protein
LKLTLFRRLQDMQKLIPASCSLDLMLIWTLGLGQECKFRPHTVEQMPNFLRIFLVLFPLGLVWRYTATSLKQDV